MSLKHREHLYCINCGHWRLHVWQYKQNHASEPKSGQIRAVPDNIFITHLYLLHNVLNLLHCPSYVLPVMNFRRRPRGRNGLLDFSLRISPFIYSLCYIESFEGVTRNFKRSDSAGRDWCG